MYADWMKNINLDITSEDLKQYEENKKKGLVIDILLHIQNN